MKQYLRPILAGFVLLVLGSAALRSYPWRGVNSDWLFYLFSPEIRLELDASEKLLAIEIVREALDGYGQPEAPSDGPADLAERFSLRDPRDVFVSLYLPPHKKSTAMAKEATLYRSLRRAARAALDQASPQAEFVKSAERVTVQVDILSARSALISTNDLYLFFAIEPGVDGLILKTKTDQHFQLPSDIIARGLLTPRRDSRLKCIRVMMEQASHDLGIRRESWKDEGMVSLERFRTISFVQLENRQEVFSLFRANVLLGENEVTSARIYRSIEEGARWLLYNSLEDGRFNYEYFPNEDRFPRTYNAVRHAGTVYGLLELYRHFQQPEFLETVGRALPYLYANIRSPGEDATLLAVPDGSSWPTGATALTVLAFVNFPRELRRDDYRDSEERMGKFLLQMIDSRGAVFEGYKAQQTSATVLKEPLYYPGETMLALAKLYEQTRDKRYLDGAIRIALYQIRQFNLIGAADHWVMQGLYELYRYTEEQKFATSAFLMADSYLDTQCPPNSPPFPDYFGAYRRDTETPRTTRAGSRSEALSAAVRLAWLLHRDARAYEDSLLFAARHQIEQQFRAETAFFFARPERVLGGFRAGLIDNHLRIDFNQHSCVGLIGALETAVKREGQVPWWNKTTLNP